MHSSISNFERRVVAAPWGLVLGIALAAVCLLAVALEMRLAGLGYRATALDSPQRWAYERARVDGLGKRALVLIGASRIQLGIDLQQMRKDTQLEPVQLAVDGSSFVPVLEDLANDPGVTGTVMIDFAPESVMAALSGEFGKSGDMVAQYRAGKLHAHYAFSEDGIEQAITDAIRENLRSDADGATPWLSFVRRVVPGQPSRQFLATNPDRSRAANYAIAPMPQTYYNRAIHDVGASADIDPGNPDAAAMIEARIALLQPYANDNLIKGTAYVKQLLEKLESHGGHVLLIKMPTTGFTREIEAKKFPDSAFLNVFERLGGRQVFDANKSAPLAIYRCPDGSHLDMRDRTAFTAGLDKELGLVASAQK